jgi:hypothetical protein
MRGCSESTWFGHAGASENRVSQAEPTLGIPVTPAMQ